jgi:hypothetical protein
VAEDASFAAAGFCKLLSHKNLNSKGQMAKGKKTKQNANLTDQHLTLNT